MSNRLIFSTELKNKLENVTNDTKIEWQSIGIFSVDDFKERVICSVNNINEKLNVSKIEFCSSLNEVEISTYFGVIQSENGKSIAYVSMIPPQYKTRSGVLSQQLFPSFSPVIQNKINSSCFRLSNLPVIIINANEVKLTAAMVINIISSKIIGFEYTDLFQRNEKEIIEAQGGNPKIKSLEEYNQLIIQFSKGNENKFFKLDALNKKVTFLTSTLKGGVSVNNEPYWYVMKAYTALILASKESYLIDMKTFENDIKQGNKTLDTFYNYAMKIKNGGNNMMQTIYYGAPGTGKSYEIDLFLKNNNISLECIFRTTFHPEYTYSDFVGQLLPNVIKSSGNITYTFSKGIFTQALEKAYEDTSVDVYLVLEEMSRGNCASIFGDIFQLLDREKIGVDKGYSKYFINNTVISKDIVRITDDKIKLPPNLSILGTVNTSDQNVFVMDTAFKRRFDWKYVSTKPVPTGGPYKNNISIDLFDEAKKISINWVDFYGVLNKFIADEKWLGLGEDKQLGQFFIEFDENSSYLTNKEKIQNKLLNYLWADIQQASYKKNINLFSDKITSFSELYDMFEKDKSIFSNEFFKCIELWKNNSL